MREGALYYIVDKNVVYYKVGKCKRLIKAKSKQDADSFSLKEANEYLSDDRVGKFTVIEAVDESLYYEPEEFVSEKTQYDLVEKEGFLDARFNDWEDVLSKLCYLGDNLPDYQNRLAEVLSDLDKEICDILHYLEFRDLDDSEMVRVCYMLQDRRRRRREIKNEIKKVSLMQSTFNRDFRLKLKQNLSCMESAKNRRYTPRILGELFEEKVSSQYDCG